jgi:hypothetical protein
MDVKGRVGQNRIFTLYMTVCLVISLPKIPFIHRIYMVLASPSYRLLSFGERNKEEVHVLGMHQATTRTRI